MARAEQDRPRTLEEAMALLKREPNHPVHAQVDELDVELRVVPPARALQQAPTRRRGSQMAALGPWEGLTTDELLRILREGRAAGGTGEPPSF